MMFGSVVRLVILSVALPVTVTLLYWLLKTKSEDDDDDEDSECAKKKRATTSRQTVIELPVPQKAVGAIIGRQGTNIKALQDCSGASIHFKDNKQDGEGDRTVVIRGTLASSQEAECLIRKVIADLPEIIQTEILVPAYALGRIIGRGGESIRQMSRLSKCKIYISRTQEAYLDKPKVVTISGTNDQIEMAKVLIQEKIDEENEFRAKAALSASQREVRKKPHDQSKHVSNSEAPHVCEPGDITSTMDKNGQMSFTHTKFPNIEDYVQVYVSAIAHPGHFWVQTVTAMSLKLDELSENMTRYYDGMGKSLTVSSLKKDDLVAAPFDNDKTWYRAMVMEVIGTKLDLLYVDYGDSAYVDISEVRSLLSSEFLSLPFQSIECRLAGVKPINGEWSEEAFNKFEELTYCAKWRVIMAKAEYFTDSIPHLSLIDTNGKEDININKEMVKCGFALPDT